MMCTNIYMISVEFHVLETNEFSQFLSLGKRQESRVVWLGYSLFHDKKKLLHCKEDVTRRMCMERYQNVAQYFEDYPPKYKINTAIHCPCYR